MKKLFKAFLLVPLLFLITLVSSCGDDKDAPKPIDPAFSAHIAAFTSGVISSESTIIIRLTKGNPNYSEEGEISKDLFDFDPDIEGRAHWVDDRTIEFIPAENLPSGVVFDAEFELGEILDVESDLEEFEFRFQTIRQSFSVDLKAVKVYQNDDLTLNKLPGTIYTADVISNEEIEKVLSARQNDRTLPISWIHETDRKTHIFYIDSVRRSEQSSEVKVTWDGDPIDVDQEDEEIVEVPALGDFKLMNAKVVQQPEQYVLLEFSDPIKENQNFDGIIRIDDYTDLKFSVEGNEVRAYPSKRLSGKRTVYIENSIRNILDYKMDEADFMEVLFRDIEPAVRLLGNGVVVPGSEKGLTFPFQAVNLSAVDVRVVKIYEDNIAQFMQVNQLDGQSQLKRVGRLLHKERVKLESDRPIDNGQWNTFSLDLSELVETEPGAIYQVEIRFKKAYSLYPCDGDEDSEENLTNLSEESDKEQEEWDQTYWDSPGYYYYHNDPYYGDYNWRERDNPCHEAYYRRSRSVSRNVLSSDLGIIAKQGNDKSMVFYVNDIQSTKAVSGVKLEVYNYQQQLLKTIETDGDGRASLKSTSHKPFLLIARKGEQRGYLRLDDGSSLSLGNFDIGGEVVQKGIKGFIYGERGVWRPGDTLFISFMLEDEKNVLPENHPVSFELINPQGQTIEKIVETSGLNGVFTFPVATEPDAPTGNWRALVKVGGASFSKVLKIEAIKPNRLSIDLDFDGEKILSGKELLDGEIKVQWLHGAIARNLKADIKATFNTSYTKFEGFKGYNFDDPVRKFSSEEIEIFDGKVNDEGVANIKRAINISESAPGMLRANFVTRAFEEGGNFSTDRFSIEYSPYSSYVGVKVPEGDYRGMLLTDSVNKIDIATVDEYGDPVSRNSLEVNVYKIDWRWWWNSGRENLAEYVGQKSSRLVDSKTISTKNGKGSYDFKIDYPEWGRYLVRVCDPVSGHCTGKVVYVDWPGWRSGKKKVQPGGASILSFSSDKEKYDVGEMATITFPSSGVGRALVSIESGSRVLNSEWIDAREKQTTYSFELTEDMTPNIYVNVILVQPHEQTANDLPIRLYGVIPIMVEDPATKLDPLIEMPDVLVPEEEATIEISEKEGRGMTYTLAVVDEGLLDLTRFKTPSPWRTFYSREALGVKTWDLYDMVLGAYGGEIEQVFGIGGGADIVGNQGNKANRFKPMVRFLGPFELEPGEKASHTIDMPRYIGSVRTMVVARDKQAYGSAEETTPVRKPLMVMSTLPRVVGPGENVKLPVTVFAMEDNIKKVSVKVETNDLFQVAGSKSQTLSFNGTGDKVVYFDLNVAENLGVGKVEVSCKGSGEKATYGIEIDVRNPNPPVTDYIEKAIKPGESWETAYDPPGMAGTNSGVIEVSNIPPIDFGRRLKYLLRYPHGCIEQTVSSAFPQLYLSDVMEVNEKMKGMIFDNVQAGLKKLRTFQLSNGAFGYWPNSGSVNEWGTNYAGHYMLEAEKKGYKLPIGLKKTWLKYQKRAARQWSPKRLASGYHYRRSGFVQAYRLYTLALSQSPELASMNRLKEYEGLSKQAKWRLAAAYLLAGQKEVADELTKNLGYHIEEYRELGYTYGSSWRDKAMILETMALAKEYDKAIPLMKQISTALSGNRWMSTQTTAYCLIGMSKFAGDMGVSNTLKFDLKVNGKSDEVKTKLPVSQTEINISNAESGKVFVSNKGDGVIYAKVTMEGTPVRGDKTSVENNLKMDVVYKNTDGKVIDVTKLDQGTDFIAEVTLVNPGIMGDYKEMALTRIFPSGWEIHNTRMDGFDAAYQTDMPTYMDIRDDRVYSYFDIRSGKKKTFSIMLNAAYLGKFYLPTVSCEAMYDDRINARKPGKWVEVVKPGSDESANID